MWKAHWGWPNKVVVFLLSNYFVLFLSKINCVHKKKLKKTKNMFIINNIFIYIYIYIRKYCAVYTQLKVEWWAKMEVNVIG